MRLTGLSAPGDWSYKHIAFLVHHTLVLEHYGPVLEVLGADNALLIVEDRVESGYGNQVQELPDEWSSRFPIVALSSALRSRDKWHIGVSNHGYMQGYMERLFDIRVRFMYGLEGTHGWNFGRINKEFDIALSHGPFSSKILRDRYGLEVFEMGYPKYAGSGGTSPTEIQRIRDTLGVNVGQPLVIWAPTLDKNCSIEDFADEFGSLDAEYAVWVKLHPMTMAQFPEQVSRLHAAGCRLTPNGLSLTQLIPSADLTLHDFGGTAMAAVFARGRPLLLEPHPETLKDLDADAPERTLRAALGTVKVGSLGNAIHVALTNESSRASTEASVEELRSEFFTDLGGNDASVAAEVLLSLKARRPPRRSIRHQATSLFMRLSQSAGQRLRRLLPVD